LSARANERFKLNNLSRASAYGSYQSRKFGVVGTARAIMKTAVLDNLYMSTKKYQSDVFRAA
jgi:hypothetical protein